jgi:hypothetical protein
MTIDEFKERLQQAQAELIANASADCFVIAAQIKALVAFRVQSRGYSFEERPFSAYTKPYAKQRAKQGYQVNYVDFTKTGKLWNNVQPFVEESNEQFTRVVITARNAEDQRKLQGAVKKRGNILKLSDNELTLLRQLAAQRVRKYFQR